MFDLLPRFGVVILLAFALPTNITLAASVPDPTRPAALFQTGTAPDAGPPAAALVLQSTLVSPQQRSAIINGQRYRIGDRIGDARLVAIGPGWVQLSTPAGNARLRLSHPTLTQPVNR